MLRILIGKEKKRKNELFTGMSGLDGYLNEISSKSTLPSNDSGTTPSSE